MVRTKKSPPRRKKQVSEENESNTSQRHTKSNVSANQTSSDPPIKSKVKKSTKDIMVGSRQYKVRMTTLRSIRYLQMSTAFCIPKLPFARLVREVLQNESQHRDMRIQVAALEALQESAEAFLVMLFEDCNLASSHARRITVMPPDIRLIMRLRGRDV